MRLDQSAATIHEMSHPSQISANNTAGRNSIANNILQICCSILKLRLVAETPFAMLVWGLLRDISVATINGQCPGLYRGGNRIRENGICC
jgi:hypothetical protein